MKLNECPFCGGTAKVLCKDNKVTIICENRCLKVVCKESTKSKSEKEASKMWNKHTGKLEEE